MRAENLLIVQGGGPTSVFNASLAGILLEAQRQPRIGKIFGARNGMKGLAEGRIVELGRLTPGELLQLKMSPGAALGSSRFKPAEEDLARSAGHLRDRGIDHLIFMGGNGTMRNAEIVSDSCRRAGLAIQIIGVPKTIDNDIAATDRCPGFASAARFVAQATIDLAADVRSLHQPVSIFETLGRDVGWLGAASSLARRDAEDAPHLVYIPEVPFEQQKFLDSVDRVVSRLGWAVVVVSEGIAYADGSVVFEQRIDSAKNSSNRPLIGGVAQHLGGLVAEHLGIRCRSEKPGLIGRSCMAYVSPQDRADAELVGREGVRALTAGHTDQMVALRPLGDSSRPGTELVPLHDCAGKKRAIPGPWLTNEPLPVGAAFQDYVRPLLGKLLHYPPVFGFHG